MYNGTLFESFFTISNPTDKASHFSLIISRFHGLVETRVIRQHFALLF